MKNLRFGLPLFMAVQLMKRICIFSIPIPASTFPNKIKRVSSIFDNIFRFIEPTILLDPPLKSQIMTEEIFGPLLPIITVRINYNNPLVVLILYY